MRFVSRPQVDAKASSRKLDQLLGESARLGLMLHHLLDRLGDSAARCHLPWVMETKPVSHRSLNFVILDRNIEAAAEDGKESPYR